MSSLSLSDPHPHVNSGIKRAWPSARPFGPEEGGVSSSIPPDTCQQGFLDAGGVVWRSC